MNASGIEILVLSLAFLGSAFFAGLEIGLVSCDRIRLRYLSERGDRRARLLLSKLVHPDRLVALTLVGTNLSSVVTSALVTAISLRTWGERGAAIAVSAYIILAILFTEIFPKALFRSRADSLVLRSAYAVAVADAVLGIPARIFHRVSMTLLQLVRSGGSAKPRLSREELAHFFERSAHAGGAGRRWFRAVLGLSERTVESALVPIEDLPAVSEGERAGAAGDRMRESGSSFLLVRGKGTGEPLGTVGVHDLLAAAPDAIIDAFIQPAPRVPAGKRIEEILPEIQAGRAPLAFVDGPDGRVIGIVTHESIAFAIVGTIEELPGNAGGESGPPRN